MALHVTVGFAGRGAQRLERDGLGFRAHEVVRTSASVSSHVLPCERPRTVRSSYTTTHRGLSARFTRHPTAAFLVRVAWGGRDQVWIATGAGCGDASWLPNARS